MAPQTVLDAIAANASFILATHQSPDGDGIGSMYALHRGLCALGKDCVSLLSQGIPSKFAFIDRKGVFSGTEADPPRLSERLAIILDTNDDMNLGSFGEAILPRAKGALFIDHHEPPSGTAPEGWIDPKAAATAEMVLELLKSLGAPLEEDMAAALYAGLVYDTGSFIYRKTTARSFEAALALVDAGASPTETHARLHENSSAEALILMKKALSGLELLSKGRIACMRLSAKDFLESGARYEDAEGLIDVPLQCKDVEVSILAKENPETGLRCSLRSKGRANVADIAQHFGGGGHSTAAGLKYAGSMDKAMEELVSLTETVLNGGRVPKPERLRPSRPKPKERSDT